MAKKAAFKALQALSKTISTGEEFIALATAANESDDPTRVIQCAGMVEDGIERALSESFIDLNRDLDDRLFGPRGYLSTFSSKIVVAHASGLISREDFRKVEALRELRNAFAHARAGMNFDAPEVRTVVLMVTSGTSKSVETTKGLRQAFAIECALLAIRIASQDASIVDSKKAAAWSAS